MKFILTEAQIDEIRNYLKEYFDVVFRVDDIKYIPGNEYGFDDEIHDEGSMWEFYIGKVQDGDLIFTWYDKTYYDESSPLFDRAPIVYISGNVPEELDSKYKKYWKTVFKEWFEESFGKSVKTVRY